VGRMTALAVADGLMLAVAAPVQATAPHARHSAKDRPHMHLRPRLMLRTVKERHGYEIIASWCTGHHHCTVARRITVGASGQHPLGKAKIRLVHRRVKERHGYKVVAYWCDGQGHCYPAARVVQTKKATIITFGDGSSGPQQLNPSILQYICWAEGIPAGTWGCPP
jgi:hypothetical protein